MANLYRVDEGGRLQLVCGVKHDDWVINVAILARRRARGERRSRRERRQAVEHRVLRSRSTSPSRWKARPSKRSRSARPAIGSPGRAKAGTIWLAPLDGSVPPTKLPRCTPTMSGRSISAPTARFSSRAAPTARFCSGARLTANWCGQLRDGGPAIFTIRFSGGGKLVAAGGVEDQIQVWDITRPKGQELVTELPAVGGANRLGFDRDGDLLAFGSDARYISMWSTSSWDKIFQLNALVGVRSIFDIHPLRGDLAFDGENGVISVLLRQDQAKAAAAERRGAAGHGCFFRRIAGQFRHGANHRDHSCRRQILRGSRQLTPVRPSRLIVTR